MGSNRPWPKPAANSPSSKARLARGRTRKTAAGIQAEIDAILAPRWVKRVITTELSGDDPASRRLRWRTDAYRSQPDVEAGFRQLKDPKVVSFSPMFHWTDQKIRVHSFYCVLALQVAHLMRRTAAQTGLHLSVRQLLATLAGIEETVLVYPSTGGRPKARRMLTEINPTQQRLYDTFNLDRYAPRA